MRLTATLILTLILLFGSAAPASSQETAPITPKEEAAAAPSPAPSATPPPAIDEDSGDEELISALERCQNETLQSRKRIRLFEKRVKDLARQVEVEKTNGGKGGAAYDKAVEELTEIRAALASARAELKLREQNEKELKNKIRKLKGELWLTRIAAGGIIGVILWLVSR